MSTPTSLPDDAALRVQSASAPPSAPGCPRCGAPLTASPRCLRCGLVLTGETASRLWQVDQQLAALSSTRRQLLARLDAESTPRTVPGGLGGLEPPGAALPGAVDEVWPGPAPDARYPSFDSPGPARGRSTGGAGLLLTLGAGVLLVAAIVFVAVAWQTLGVAGQLAIMAFAAGASLVGSRISLRHDMPGTAEATGTLFVGLVVITAAAVWNLAIDTPEHPPGISGAAYTALVAVGLTVVSASLLTIAPTRALGACSAGSVGVAMLTGTIAAAPEEGNWPWVGLVFLGLLTALTLLARHLADQQLAARQLDGQGVSEVRGLARMRHAALQAAAAMLIAVALGVGTVTVLVCAWLITEGGWPIYAIVTLTALAVITALAWARSTAGNRTGWALAAIGTTTGLVVSAATQSTGRDLVIAAALTLVVVTATVLLGSNGRSGSGAQAPRSGTDAPGAPQEEVPGDQAWLPAMLAPLRTLALVVISALLVIGGPSASRGAVAGVAALVSLAWLVAAGASGLPSPWRNAPSRPLMLGAAASAGLLSLAAAAPPANRLAPLLLTLGVLAVAAAASRAAHPATETILGLVCAVGGATSVLWALGADVPGLVEPTDPYQPEELPLPTELTRFGGVAVVSIVLAVLGVGALAYALRRGRGWLAAVGLALVAAGIWGGLAAEGVVVLEAYTLPVAALLLAVGAVIARRQESSSWEARGAGWAVALLPSAVASTADSGLARAAVVLVLGAALLLVGLRGRWQAEVVVGAAAVVISALGQVGPWAAGLPRWLTLGIVGALLLWTGTRYERRRADALRARAWLSALD